MGQALEKLAARRLSRNDRQGEPLPKGVHDP